MYGSICMESCPQGTVILNNECINTICPQGYYKSPSSNKCLKACPEGYQSLEIERKCVLCHYTCLTCSGSLINNCLTCPEGSSISYNKCTEDKSQLTFNIQRVPLQAYEFKLMFSKKITNESAAIVKSRIILNIDGVDPSTYN